MVLASMLAAFGSSHFRIAGPHTHSPFGADLIQEWVAGDLILTGRASDIYSRHAFADAQHDFQKLGFTWDERYFFVGVYPPAYYFWISFIATLPYIATVYVWWLAMIGLLFATALLWQVQPQVADRASYRNSCAVLWTLAPFFPAVLTNITMGQKGLLWMFLFSLVVFAWNRRFRFLSGLLFGLFALKPTLLFFLPLLMLRSRHYSFVAGATVSCLTLYGIAFLFLPLDCWEHFLGTALHATRYHEQAGYDFSWTCNLLSYVPVLRSSGYPAVEWVVLLPVILFTIYRSAQKTIDLSDPKDLTKAMLGTMLLSPHFYHYDTVILLVPISMMLATKRSVGFSLFGILWIALACSGWFYSALGLSILPILCLILLDWISSNQSSTSVITKFSTQFLRYPLNRWVT